jgi:serine/threonine-protein kinase RsbW
MAKMAKHSDKCSKAGGMSPDRLELKINSDPATLRDVRKALEEYAARHGGDECCQNDIGLCVNEALANVMRHAYRGVKDQPIEVSIEDVGERLVIRLRDWGQPFDPAVLKDRKYDPLEPGGLGVICMRRMMDQVSYVPKEKGMLLTLERRKRG